MQLNAPASNPNRTHEGAPASHLKPIQALRRSVLACMLWEDQFYESGEDIALRIQSLVGQCTPTEVMDLAIEARTSMKLRHAPLLLARAMAALPEHKLLVGHTLEQIVQRPDELTEFLAIYWKDGKRPLAAQVKKGLARAFTKFSEYDLAKYNRDKAIKLRDVLFLTHAKPKDEEQAAMWKRLVDGTLATPDTWEVALSGGADKRETFERLIAEGKLGALALLRNMRNMHQAGVQRDVVWGGLERMRVDRVLPFRFIAASRAVPQWEDLLEGPMLKCLDGREKLPGKTVLLVDTSGSMSANLSAKSDLNRLDAAAGLAILARELCENVEIYTFNEQLKVVPARRGFALRDAIGRPSGGTYLGAAVSTINANVAYNRLIVLTDEQSYDVVGNPHGLGYMINVASYKNGVGYGPWHKIDGWSEAVFDYIIENERT